MREENSGIDLHLPGTVRWCEPRCDGTWSVGCLSSEPLAWETLGELILSGVVSTEAPPPAT